MSTVIKYTNKWQLEHESIFDGKDAKRVAKGSQPIAHIKKELGKKLEFGDTRGLRSATVIVNMWDVQTLAVMPKVHALVFQFERCNPKKPDQNIKIRKSDKFRPDDVKLVATKIVEKWLIDLNRPNEHLKYFCSDGNELLFFHSAYFSVEDIKSINETSAEVETSLDFRKSLYKAKIGVAGTDLQLDNKNPGEPLKLNGSNKHGLEIKSIDVFAAAIMWQPGHPVDTLGNGRYGWQSNGNTIIYDFGKGVKLAGYPVIQQNTNWVSAIKDANLRELLLHMRPDPIDEFAPDSRRELAKGLVVDILAARNGNILVRADINRPIQFTSVSNMSPFNNNRSNNSYDASLVEEFLHRCAIMSNSPGRFSWGNLFAGNMPSTKQLYELSDRFKNSIRRLPVVQKYVENGHRLMTFKRRIFQLMPENADEYRFEYDGRSVSVTEYYKERYNVTLRHGKTLPLVDVSEVKSKATAVPMELCFIETHRCSAAQLLACRSSNDVPAEVTTAILKCAALPGEARYGQTKTYLNVSGVGRGDTANKFGLNVSGNIMKVDGVELPPPPIEFSNGIIEACDTSKGGWRTPRGANYRQSMSLGKEWFCVVHNSLTKHWNTIIKQPFLAEMAQTAKKMGINWQMCDEKYMVDYGTENELITGLENRFQQVNMKANLVLLIMPSRSPPIYRAIKQWCDVANGVASQCILFSTISKSVKTGRGVNQDTIFNLLLKINAKMGGANWTFTADPKDSISKNLLNLRDQTLYLGADVRHPQPNRCTRHPLCAHTWHSRRECPNIALAKLANVSPTSNSPSTGDQGHTTPESDEQAANSNDKGKDTDSQSERSMSPSSSPHGTRASSKSPDRSKGKGSSSRSSSSKSSTSSSSQSEHGDGKKEFSYAAISGTLSTDASRTGCTIRVQTAGKEELVHITDALVERIKEYIAFNNGHKPKRIVYIRDGVADDQITRIIQEEWHCLKDACERLSMGYNPYIVFVLAQKSHSLRMFLEGGDKGNVRMGTVLSSKSGVTANNYNDFYMVGHRALQGTSKPLRYILLKEGFADDKSKEAKSEPPNEYVCSEVGLMRELFSLHLMNARAQKACRLPAPVTHAHLAAERATIHAQDKMEGVQAAQNTKVHKNTLRRMYWM